MSKEEQNQSNHARPGMADPELGMLGRFREWNDILPWMRLSRTMRLIVSPSLLLMTFFTLCIWHWGAASILQDDFPNQLRVNSSEVTLGSSLQALTGFSKNAYQMHPSSIMRFGERLASWKWLAASLWSVFIWLIPAMIIVRQGVVLTAGRGMDPFVSLVRLVRQRLITAFSMFVVTLFAPAVIALGLWLLTRLSIHLSASPLIVWPSLMLVLPVSLLGGLLILVSYFSLPLGVGAIMAEPDADAIDAVSRGYESCLRRPLKLAAYMIIQCVLLVVTFLIATAIAAIAMSFIQLGEADLISQRSEFLSTAASMLSVFPSTCVAILALGGLGGFYLLLRYDTCEQEIEDIWQVCPASSVALPKLGVQSMDSPELSD